MDGELIAVDAAADKYTLKWVTDLTFGYEHTPCIVLESDGTVYAASRRGAVAAVDAASGELLWVRRIGRSAVNGFERDTDGTGISLNDRGNCMAYIPHREERRKIVFSDTIK